MSQNIGFTNNERSPANGFSAHGMKDLLNGKYKQFAERERQNHMDFDEDEV